MGFKQRIFNWLSDTEKREVTYGTISEYTGLAGYGDTPNNIKVTEKTALALSAVWASIKIPAESMASVPKGAYYKDKKGNSIYASNSPANNLLLKPNKVMNGYTWQLAMGYSFRTDNNAYSQIVRNNNNWPIELVPIHYSRVEPEIVDGELFYVVDGQLRINSDDMLHFKGLTRDGIKGIRPLVAAAQTIGMALSTQNSRKTFYEKGSNIDVVLKHPNKLDIGVVKNTKTSWNAQMSGTSGDRMAIVDGGFDIEQLKLTAAEMQFLEASKASIPDIARYFTMPLNKLAEFGADTKSNVEQQNIDYVTDTLMPFAACFEAELNAKLLLENERKQGYYIKYNLNGLMRGDYKSRVEGYRIWHSMGVPLNPLLALDEMNPVEGGDVSLVPLNMISAGRLDEYHFLSNEQKNTSNTPRETKRNNGHTLEELLK